ncbi:hypothetical protein TTHERM_00227850 (macronuclear) [Tetrahymena thermophila SB210]|uniref:AMP-binding enzyme family protein n=1 Tax=Tetrahymena thermophila (strain SB210) TaxID=312017 RepID=Q23BP7_TETTS|nr:hypothetical protein TTHERM_00227850 [Tetrahymena thermophila SB210]EAR94071.2 hypothetical protein TTHERM_00227850 [Tetrahymena thermophila SB210]|eukprot:XP_001014316.2 hypothetical protein TTHERM_00227850 [Tetrahymena thermophila SB210]
MNNQIDPKFIQQNFITEESIDLDLHNNLIAFRYEYIPNTSLNDLQRNQNQTYLVFLPYFLYQNNSQNNLIKLNVVECSDPQLNGFNCLDFSSVSNFSLTLSALQGIVSRIFIFTYRCQDTDIYKTDIPNNCASQEQIDNLISNTSSSLHIKLYTSQYNTSSQMVQVNYRNAYLNLLGDQFQLSIFKTQKQMTSVSSGAIIQKKSTFSSPIQYQLQNQNFDRQIFIQKTNLKLILQISVEMDEIIQYSQIQYHTFPEILAVCNSTLALLMCVGILARKFASQLIFEDIFLLFLQNMYQGTYQKMLKLNKQLGKKEVAQPQNEKQIEDCFVEEESENAKSIVIPNFEAQQIKSLTIIKNKIVGQEGEQCSIQGLKKESNDMTMDSFNLQLCNQCCLNKTNIQSPLKISDQAVCPEQVIINEEKKPIQIIQPRKFSKPKTQIQQTKNIFDSSQNIQLNQSKFLSKQAIIFSGCNLKQQQEQDKTKLSKSNEKQQKQKLNYTAMFDHSVIKKIQKVIFGKRIKKNEYLQQQGLDPKTKEKIEEQVFKSLDILQIFKELMFLKKAVLVLLSKQQLAALKLVGCSSEIYLSQLQNTEIKQNNYFEDQICLLESDDQQFEQITKFLQRCQEQGKDLCQIDQRIFSSLCIQLKDKLID